MVQSCVGVVNYCTDSVRNNKLVNYFGSNGEYNTAAQPTPQSTSLLRVVKFIRITIRRKIFIKLAREVVIRRFYDYLVKSNFIATTKS